MADIDPEKKIAVLKKAVLQLTRQKQELEAANRALEEKTVIISDELARVNEHNTSLQDKNGALERELDELRSRAAQGIGSKLLGVASYMPRWGTGAGTSASRPSAPAAIALASTSTAPQQPGADTASGAPALDPHQLFKENEMLHIQLFDVRSSLEAELKAVRASLKKVEERHAAAARAADEQAAAAAATIADLEGKLSASARGGKAAPALAPDASRWLNGSLLAAPLLDGSAYSGGGGGGHEELVTLLRRWKSIAGLLCGGAIVVLQNAAAAATPASVGGEKRVRGGATMAAAVSRAKTLRVALRQWLRSFEAALEAVCDAPAQQGELPTLSTVGDVAQRLAAVVRLLDSHSRDIAAVLLCCCSSSSSSTTPADADAAVNELCAAAADCGAAFARDVVSVGALCYCAGHTQLTPAALAAVTTAWVPATGFLVRFATAASGFADVLRLDYSSGEGAATSLNDRAAAIATALHQAAAELRRLGQARRAQRHNRRTALEVASERADVWLNSAGASATGAIHDVALLRCGLAAARAALPCLAPVVVQREGGERAAPASQLQPNSAATAGAHGGVQEKGEASSLERAAVREATLRLLLQAADAKAVDLNASSMQLLVELEERTRRVDAFACEVDTLRDRCQKADAERASIAEAYEAQIALLSERLAELAPGE